MCRRARPPLSKSLTQDVTEVLAALDRGERDAAERLLPLVYEQLRHLAHSKMAKEPAGLTLQPTALVHEAYLRLVDESGVHFKNRAHFFGAAAEAMRRILIERARQKSRLKHGGGRKREELGTNLDSNQDPESFDLVALDDALTKLAAMDHRLRDVVMLRFFAGLSVEQTAEVMEISERTIKRDWEFARTWLHREMLRARDETDEASAPE